MTEIEQRRLIRVWANNEQNRRKHYKVYKGIYTGELEHSCKTYVKRYLRSDENLQKGKKTKTNKQKIHQNNCQQQEKLSPNMTGDEIWDHIRTYEHQRTGELVTKDFSEVQMYELKIP